jgi:hypothetical protein
VWYSGGTNRRATGARSKRSDSRNLSTDAAAVKIAKLFEASEVPTVAVGGAMGDTTKLPSL